MKRFDVTLKGTTPLMHHKMTDEALMSLLGAKTKKKKVSEEKTPRDIAETHAYRAPDRTFYIPLGYVSGAFAHVASDYKQSNSQRKSYKAIAGGVLRPETEGATLIDPETEQPLTDYEVSILKATNHKAGAVAVCRPRFDRWATKFQVSINTDLLPSDLALQILNDAGQRSGIGSFRVSKGGYYGQFVVTNFEPCKE